MKVKIFSEIINAKFTLFGRLKEPLCHRLEDQMNAWFSQNPAIKIHQIEQNVSGGAFLGEAEKIIITVFYED